MTLRSTAGGLAVALGFALSACGPGPKKSPDAGADAGSSCAVDAGPLDPGEIQRGFDLIQQNQCQQCHGTLMDGNPDGVQVAGTQIQQYPPNLTPDPATGLGCWTDGQIVTAILTGVDNQGQPLCGPMPHFASVGLSQSDAEAIVTYLRSLPALPVNVQNAPDCSCQKDTDCPPLENCVNQTCTCLSLDCAFGGSVPGEDGGTIDDGGVVEAGGALDAGEADAGSTDAGELDAGGSDAGAPDAGVDAGTDAGAADAGEADAGEADAGVDAGELDAGAADGGVDAGERDAGTADAGAPDAGTDAG